MEPYILEVDIPSYDYEIFHSNSSMRLMTLPVQEILVDGKPDQQLMSLVDGNGEVWRSLDDCVTITLAFAGMSVIRSMYLEFWAVCHADSIRVYYDGQTHGSESSWQILGGEGDCVIEGSVNRRIFLQDIGVTTRKLKIELSHGHLDTFSRRYRLGLKNVEIGGYPATPLDADSEPTFIDTNKPVPVNEIYTPGTVKRVRRRDPLFVFPAADVVMAAILQTGTSPWRLLSGKSNHKQKLVGKLGEKPRLYILPRLGIPSLTSIPSRSDILRLHASSSVA